jgi:hypothetical protein
MNYDLKSDKVSGFAQSNQAAKLLPTSQLMDVLPRLKLLNALTSLTPLLSSLVRSFTAKGIYLHEPIQGLNLNLQSISGLEPKMPVTYSPRINIRVASSNL